MGEPQNGFMKQTRRLLLAAAALIVLSTTAAAQTRDPSTNTTLAILDECLASLKGEASFDAAMTRRGFQRSSNGGWVQRVGPAIISASTGTNTIRGLPAKLCAVTMAPQSSDPAGLDAAVASRARPWNLKYMSPGPGNGGGQMRGWANLDGSGLIGITINDAPAQGNVGPNTTVSAIWR